MDPEATYIGMVNAAHNIQNALDEIPEDTAPSMDDLTDIATLADQLATYVLSLDGWLKKGGYRPKAWDK